ncbi:trypsin inhibitor-like [Bombyx mandarina]|uniref:Trypsin inhibitor-like n=1 Tax=Bombyx mandarina TaxID=7092 RepID=A0A6J2JSY9_BOMMA|nr:trypsin inhibitor-like [Bombyx mandarina]
MLKYTSISFLLIILLFSFTNANPDCSLPAKTGPCRGYFERYAYDSSKHKCVKFIYGGCQQNANNFETLEKCRAACP